MSTDHETETPPGPPSPQRRVLRRSRNHKVLGGIAGGVSEYLGVDVVIIRIAFVVLACMAGSGMLVYLAAWILLPKAHKTASLQPLHQTRLGNLDGHQLLAIALVGIGAIALFDRLGFGFDGDMVLPVVLIGFGVAVLVSSKSPNSTRGSLPNGPIATSGAAPVDRATMPGTFPDSASTIKPVWPGGSPTSSPTASELTEPVTALDEFDRLRAPRAHEFEAGHLLSTPLPSPPGPTPLSKGVAVRKRTPFARSAFGMLLVIVGLIFVGTRTGLITGGIDAALAVMLLAVGGFLVVGAWLGRPRGFVAIGTLLTLTLGLFSLTGTSWRGGFGERDFTPATVSDLKPDYHLMGGVMYLNLSKLNLYGQGKRIAVDVSVGAVAIELPKGMNVKVNGSAGIGQITLFGKTSDGAGVTSRSTLGQTGKRATLTIDARVGLGALEVAEIGHLQKLTDLPSTGNSR